MAGKKVKALAKSAEFEPQAGSLRWQAIREDYIAQNIARQKGQKAFTLRDCAEAHSVSYHYLRQIAGAQKWNKLLKERIEERSRQAVETVQAVSLYDEIEIRTRHATYARLASSIAQTKLASLNVEDIKKLTIKDAIELMRLGLDEERVALGLKKDAPPPGGMDSPDAGRVLSPDQVFAVARRVIDLKRGTDGSYATDAGA